MGRRRGDQRLRHAGPAVLVLALLAAAFPVGAVPPPLQPVIVALKATSPTTFVLGRAFTFDIVLKNQMPVPVAGRLDVEFLGPQGTVLPLEGWTGLIAGGGTVRESRFVVSGRWTEVTGRFRAQARGSFTLQALGEIGAVAAPFAELPVTIQASPVPIPRFVDVTQDVGITTVLTSGGFCQDYVAGAAWGDVNEDGRSDLFIPQRTGPSELWINEPAGFVERGALYGVQNKNPDGTVRRAVGSNFIDYDADGRLDLFVVNDGVNRLYRNTAGGFVDVAAAAGIAADANHTSAAWGDYDGDGNLDLFVTSHGRRPACPDFFEHFLARLYKGNGSGGFTEVTSLLPRPGPDNGLSFQGSFFDYNNDGRLDIYISNDHIAPQDEVNILWRNDGPSGFTNVSVPSGAGITANAMGTGIGDFNRDGFFDIAVSDLGRPLSLLRNNGDGTFTNVVETVGLRRGDESQGGRKATWGLSFEDLNGDGWEDLYVNAGQLETNGEPTEEQPNQVFVNDGAGMFLDLSRPSGADDPAVSRDSAFADYDGDGRVDMFVMNQDGVPRLLRNVTPGFGNWLGVNVTGPGGRAACGARVEAMIPGQPPMERHVYCGSTGLGSGSDPVIRLGLGSVTGVSLRVRWPTGETLTLGGISAGQVVTIPQP